MENVVVDSQFCEPDSTVNIDVIREPPPPTPLQIVQQQYRVHQTWCSEMLQGCMSARGQVRGQLEEMQERCKGAIANLQSLNEVRETTIQAAKTLKLQLNEVNFKCSELQAELDTELDWRPEIPFCEKEQQELIERVQYMRSLLRDEIQLPSGIQSPDGS